MNTFEIKNINENTTLMLDMDGTILDLAYDSHIWLRLIPNIYAENMNIEIDDDAAGNIVTVQDALDYITENA